MSRVGIRCKLYRNTGTWGSPTWDEVTCVSDFKVDKKWAEAAFVTRETPVEQTLKTFLQLSLTGKLQVRNGSGDYQTIDDAMNARTKLDLMVLNGANNENDVRGYRFHAQVFDGSQDQGPGAALLDDVMFKPTAPDIATELPQSVLVTTGAPVFTTLTN